MKTFEELGVCEEIRHAIEEMGFVQPMPVQEEVIPYLLENKQDVIALAQTGTGKTAAFGIPVLQRIAEKPRPHLGEVGRGLPLALILAPTRELCLQIADDLRDFGKYLEGIHIEAITVLGFCLSNGVVALSGGLMAQYQGFADINMGRGAIVIGLAAIIIGEGLARAVLGKHLNFFGTLSFTVLGGVVYYLVVVLVLWLRLNSNDLKLFTAVIVAIFLGLPHLKEKLNSRRKKEADVHA